MSDTEKLKKAIELIESAISDFQKLQPILGESAQAIAVIYQEELNALKP